MSLGLARGGWMDPSPPLSFYLASLSTPQLTVPARCRAAGLEMEGRPLCRCGVCHTPPVERERKREDAALSSKSVGLAPIRSLCSHTWKYFFSSPFAQRALRDTGRLRSHMPMATTRFCRSLSGRGVRRAEGGPPPRITRIHPPTLHRAPVVAVAAASAAAPAPPPCPAGHVASSTSPCPGDDTPCLGGEDPSRAAAPLPHPLSLCPAGLSRADKEAVLGTGARGCIVWFTGLSGAGKSAVAGAVERELAARGIPSARLDGDCLRTGLCAGLGFSRADRAENVRRAGEAALLAAEAGLVALAALVSPYLADRAGIRARCAESAGPGRCGGGVPFIEVYVGAPLAVCETRDAKGLYAAARAGKLAGLTGVCPTAPYEPPDGAEVVLGGEGDVREAAGAVVECLEARGLVPRR